MGGDHHHHGPPYKVPDYRIYKVDHNTPELLEMQNLLKSRGLKDPWMRNEVWRYHRDITGPKNFKATWGRVVWRRFGTGLAIALALVGIEKGYDTYYGTGDHGHGAGHGHH